MKHIPVRYVVLAAVVAVAGFLVWQLGRPEPVEVQLYTVERGEVRSTVANTRVGTVKACRRSMLAPTTGGEVSLLTVKEGDRVAPGDVLLEVWNEDLKAQLNLARAQKITAAARADEACKRAQGARRELSRLEKLLTDKLVAEEQVDLARTEHESRQASCAAARAAVDESEAHINVIQTSLERTVVRAPFEGVVAEVNAELGEYVTPSPPGIPTLPAIDLLDMSCVYVSAPIDEVDAPPITTGMNACVSLDAFPDRRCNAVVSRIAPYVLDREKQARTVEVEVVLSGEEDVAGLLPGYSADIEIVLAVHSDVLRIPAEAVLENNEVYLYRPATGTIEKHAFEAGLSNWNFVEVTAGLQQGDQIVLSVGADGVEDGALVVPGPGGNSD